ncbi:MAG: hypothetical protein M3R35_02370 [Candidatus Eremiobacteraeota bacterium]|nr:hypothetical protein [Candidatus Eremiobacteraeota bacterium]
MISRLRRVNVIQLALVAGVIYGIIGLIIGLIWMPFTAMMAAAMPMGRGLMAGPGFLAIILFPIFYFIGGFIAGLIFAALYNLVAGWTGGIEVTLDSVVAPTIV